MNHPTVNNSLSTGCPSIDQLLGGGIPRSQITLVYGEPNTGKTTLAIQSAVESARKGFKTIYIDSDNTFSAVRLSQIASSDLDAVSSLIFILKPRSFHEQSLLFEDLDRYLAKNVSLVIVDTISSLYRLELRRSETVFTLNRELNRQIAYLGEAAKTNNIAVLILSQVRAIVNGDNNTRTTEPVATRLLRFWSNTILNLKNTPQQSIREATLEKSPTQTSGHTYYKLERTGIQPINQGNNAEIHGKIVQNHDENSPKPCENQPSLKG